MTRKNKVKEKRYTHKKAVIDVCTIEDFLDETEYTELIETANDSDENTFHKFTQAQEALIRLKKWLESRV